jgi:hypothetical protein
MPAPAARQLADRLARYTPEIADAIAACRRKLGARVPRGYELIYDHDQALAFGYAWADKAAACLVSLAAYPDWVTLFFLDGQQLPDPQGLLQHHGERVRSLRLQSPQDLDRPAIRTLLDLALAPHAERFAAAPPLVTVVKALHVRPAG